MSDERLEVDLVLRDESDSELVVAGTVAEGALHGQLLDEEHGDGDGDFRSAHTDLKRRNIVNTE